MITSINEYKRYLKESYEDDVAKFRAFIKEHPELSILPIKLSPDGKPISKIYRTVKQTDLFDDIYGTHDVKNNKGRPYYMTVVYANFGKMDPLPTTKPLTLLNAEVESDEPGWDHTTDWTIDRDYYYQVHDEVIRICLDFNKVKAIVGNDNILNLLHDGEAEIRLRNPIPLLQTLDHIEILEQSFNEDVEGEYGIDRAIKKWFPKELMPYLKLVDYMPMQTPAYSKSLDKYYDDLYAKYGVKPIKPYGNTWIDQKL